MGFTIELRRVVSKARTGRVAGTGPALGVIERIVEDGELHAAVKRLGVYRLPTLAGLDPYRNTTLRATAVDEMVGEIERSGLEGLQGVEREVLATLLEWGRRCRGDRALVIGFVGD
ncbi:hypothetical protein Kpho02_32380 [Kitasatospora phosalacinea]|uniref:Uncharacterized protein n=1 Tax=Kitasatospora phosalacinea TaxID=2065 RepID=A0A9W6V0K6_9ACTN|nr:hypothetical protein [Kitasatospora phosalacinea]GLW70939.1 hypothetical protein Kpho02_32380 [Kitasatospora phosalacinea]